MSLNKLKYFIKGFDWMRVYNSPFKPPVLYFHIGKIALGTPYFFPRNTRKSKTKLGYLEFIPKKIGFDFVALGWKTKFDDYRNEWNPRWSFVFFGYQIAITFAPPYDMHYWECWLYYTRKTDKTKSTRERIAECREKNPCIWTVSTTGHKKETIDNYTKILKEKWL